MPANKTWTVVLYNEDTGEVIHSHCVCPTAQQAARDSVIALIQADYDATGEYDGIHVIGIGKGDFELEQSLVNPYEIAKEMCDNDDEDQ